MTPATQPEPWLRGPIAGIPPSLMPIAHSLQQAAEDLPRIVAQLPPTYLWAKPGCAASAGFHLKHLRGSLERLFTYAIGDTLSERQLAELKSEKDETGETPEELLQNALCQIDMALQQLREVDPARIYEERKVGRAQLPSTQIGLFYHAAEHIQRHIGALIATVKFVQHIAQKDQTA